MKLAIKKTSQALREIVPERKKNITKKDKRDRYDDQYDAETDDEEDRNEDNNQDEFKDEIEDEQYGSFKFNTPPAVSFDKKLPNSEVDEGEDSEDDKDFKQMIDNIDFLLRRPTLTLQISDCTFGTVPSFFEGIDSTVI
jgi:hypothetical protein